MLRDSDNPADAIFAVPELTVDGLFMERETSIPTPRPTIAAVHPNVVSHGGLISPRSPPSVTGSWRPIDPQLVSLRAVRRPELIDERVPSLYTNVRVSWTRTKSVGSHTNRQKILHHAMSII